MCLVGLGIGVFYGYWVYRNNQEEAAQFALATCLEDMERASVDESSIWPTVALASETGYRQHSGSSLAPYFLALEAQSLVAQGKLSEAIASLDRVVGMIAKVLRYIIYMQSNWHA